MPFGAIMNAILFLPVALAVPWIGATPTPAAGLMAMNGMSPRPTEAPGDRIIPQELLKRDQSYSFPPPNNWCGFVTGNYSNPLTCGASYTCLVNDYAFACCNPQTACNFYTGCIVATTTTSTQTGILYCSGSTRSACGTYAFSGGDRYVYHCTDSSAFSEVEYLNDFYSTAIGSTIGSNGFPVAVGSGGSTSALSASASFASASFASASSASATSASAASVSAASTSTVTTGSHTGLPVNTTTAAAGSHTGLRAGAIAGIAVGAGCVGLAVIAGIFVCCIKQKRRRAQTAAQQTQSQPLSTFNHNPPMQQVFADQAYRPNYAQSNQYPPSKPGMLDESPGSPQTSTYASTYNGHSSPINTSFFTNDPTNRMNNISPPPLPYNHSTPTHISPVSQKPPIWGDETSATNYFRPSSPPIITDAGGVGAKPAHTTADGKNQLHEVSGVPIHVQDQNQAQTLGQSQGVTVHEISAQPEPKYYAYSPTSPPQH